MAAICETVRAAPNACPIYRCHHGGSGRPPRDGPFLKQNGAKGRHTQEAVRRARIPAIQGSQGEAPMRKFELKEQCGASIRIRNR